MAQFFLRFIFVFGTQREARDAYKCALRRVKRRGQRIYNIGIETDERACSFHLIARSRDDLQNRLGKHCRLAQLWLTSPLSQSPQSFEHITNLYSTKLQNVLPTRRPASLAAVQSPCLSANNSAPLRKLPPWPPEHRARSQAGWPTRQCVQQRKSGRESTRCCYIG